MRNSNREYPVERCIDLLREPSTKRYLSYLLVSLIPPGYTVSYSTIAKLIGTSARAVAQFMRSNPCPIIIPCHRVVGSDGSLRGYSMGGVAMKERLLKLEGVDVNAGRVSRAKLIKDVSSFWSIVENHGVEVNAKLD